jgi:hypothetical protein
MFGFLHQYRARKLERKGAEFTDGTRYELVLLYKKGVVRAHATGQSITNIRGEVENLLMKSLQVSVEPGTYFVARGDFQNMVTREPYHFSLGPQERRTVSINATCINAGRPVPSETDRFDGVARVPDDVGRFLKAAQGAGPMVVQAGVWALTDGYTGSQIRAHLVRQDRVGNRVSAVSEQDIARARRILDGLGIQHRL